MISNNMLHNPNNRYYNVANNTLDEIMNLSDNIEFQRKNIADDYQHHAKLNSKVANYQLDQAMTDLVNNSMKSIKDIMHTYQPIADKEWFDETETQMNKHDE